MSPSSFRNVVFSKYLEIRAMGKVQKSNDSHYFVHLLYYTMRWHVSPKRRYLSLRPYGFAPYEIRNFNIGLCEDLNY
jgi:hypothetical protein